FDIMYGQGISRIGELLDLAVSIDIIKKSGAWFSYDGNRIAQGRDNAKIYLKDNPEIAKKIEEEVLANKDKFTFAKVSKSTKGKGKGKDAANDDAEQEIEQDMPIPDEPVEPRTSNSDIDIMVEE
ncbi:MAG: DNA recombination/repair protein RecA, partial [Clostridia bacterium]|nr:DNA recombination/repair protein RecA [Clostridia bacterium]